MVDWIARNGIVRAGDWRTLDYGWNASFACKFQFPVGAQVKIRYGIGWLGWDGQKRTLDGSDKIVAVSASVFYARVQMKVQNDSRIDWLYSPTGP